MTPSLALSARGVPRKLWMLWRDEGIGAVVRRGFYKHSVFYIWENHLVTGNLPPVDLGEVVVERIRVPLSLEEFEAAYRTGRNEQVELPAATLDTAALEHLPQRVGWREIEASTIVFRALLDGTVVHQTWIGVGRRGCGQYVHFYPELRDRGRTAYCGLSWTSPLARGRGLLSQMYAHMYGFLAASGCEVAVDAVKRHVQAAHKTQERMGARHIQDGHAVRLAGLVTVRYTTGRCAGREVD